MGTDRNTGILTRRTVLGGIASLAAGGVAAPALAAGKNPIDLILKNRKHGAWMEQFDARNAGRNETETTVPIFSPQTPQFIELAIREYNKLVANRGWPVVPAGNKLKLASSGSAVSIMRKRLVISGDLAPDAGFSETFDSYVESAVKRFQRRHGLPDDGVVGRYTFATMNVPASVRLGQLETNLVRLRSMSGFLGDRYVMVNIPAAQIEAVEYERVVGRHTAIVGKIDRQTPILNSKIYQLNLNPYWTAPVSIVKKDLIPLMQRDPKYMERNKIRIFAPDNSELDPAAIDWNTDEALNYRFRQEPGKINAMGSVKINFPNPHAVYMHDTPQQSVFGKLLRFESSGCVRVQNVRDLITWLAKDTEGWDRRAIEAVIESGERIDVELLEPVPVYFTYVSAWSSAGGVVQFRDDIYHRDGAQELALQ